MDEHGSLTLAQLDEVSLGARAAELEAKHARLAALLERENLDAVLLSRHASIAWLTAGQVEARVLIPADTAVCTLLVLRDSRRFYLVPENEAPRLAAEEFPGLGYEPVLYPWYESPSEVVTRLVLGNRIGSDTGGAYLPVDLTPLQAPLLAPEIARLRWLSHKTANVVQSILQALEPGDSEYRMEAEVARLLLLEGILPSVLLMAVDDRILAYKHAVARGAKLAKFGMLNLCTRKWGLAVSITRFVHSWPVPEELERGFDVAARVNAALLDATREGASSGDLFRVAQQAYAEAGFPGEEQKHHQGGPCGYQERDWVASPAGEQTVRLPQAFAWNPSCRGGKVEDTVLVTNHGIEILTATPELPMVETIVNSKTYPSTGLLVVD